MTFPIGMIIVMLFACMGSILYPTKGFSPVTTSNNDPKSAACTYPGGYNPDLIPWDCYGAGSFLYTCGSTHRCSSDDYDLTLVKWDLSGNVLWNRSYSALGPDYGESVWANASCVFTFGYTQTMTGALADLLLVKWNPTGQILWNRTWGGLDEEIGYAVWGDNNSIYTVGSTKSVGAGLNDLILMKWDTNGNLLWYKTWGWSDSNDYGFDVWGDGNYVYTCGKSDHWNNNFDIVFIKWATNGTEIWNSHWGGPYEERGSSLFGNGSVIYTCGRIDPNSNGPSDLVLVKWADNGTILWNRTWGGLYEDRAYKMWADATYIYTCGWTQDYSYGDFALSLIKWDSNGNRLWNRTLSGNELPFPLEWGGTECCWDGDYSFDVYGMAVWGSGSSIFACGYVSGYPPHYADVAVSKWDYQGTFYWVKTWGTPCDAPTCDPGYDFPLLLIVGFLAFLGLVLGLSYHLSVSRRSLRPRYTPERPIPASQNVVLRPRFCYNCGAEHPLDALYCPLCGAPLYNGR